MHRQGHGQGLESVFQKDKVYFCKLDIHNSQYLLLCLVGLVDWIHNYFYENPYYDEFILLLTYLYHRKMISSQLVPLLSFKLSFLVLRCTLELRSEQSFQQERA